MKINRLTTSMPRLLQHSSNFDVLGVYTFQQHFLNAAEISCVPWAASLIPAAEVLKEARLSRTGYCSCLSLQMWGKCMVRGAIGKGIKLNLIPACSSLWKMPVLELFYMSMYCGDSSMPFLLLNSIKSFPREFTARICFFE